MEIRKYLVDAKSTPSYSWTYIYQYSKIDPIEGVKYVQKNIQKFIKYEKGQNLYMPNNLGQTLY